MDAQGIAFAAFALGRNLVYLAIGLAILIGASWILFLWMNRSIGLTFSEHVWPKMQNDPKAVALYFGLRVLGVLVAGGWIAAAFLK
jgi:hypothetical protein